MTIVCVRQSREKGDSSKAARSNGRRHTWNGKPKPLAGVADGTGCAHHFKLPTPDPNVEPVGICSKCGLKRMHSNVGSGFEPLISPWRAWQIGHDAMRDEHAFRLPAGYHLAGPVE